MSGERSPTAVTDVEFGRRLWGGARKWVMIDVSRHVPRDELSSDISILCGLYALRVPEEVQKFAHSGSDMAVFRIVKAEARIGRRPLG